MVGVVEENTGPQPVCHEQHQSAGWGRQCVALRCHAVAQRRPEVNIKHGTKEHQVHDEPDGKQPHCDMYFPLCASLCASCEPPAPCQHQQQAGL